MFSHVHPMIKVTSAPCPPQGVHEAAALRNRGGHRSTRGRAFPPEAFPAPPVTATSHRSRYLSAVAPAASKRDVKLPADRHDSNQGQSAARDAAPRRLSNKEIVQLFVRGPPPQSLVNASDVLEAEAETQHEALGMAPRQSHLSDYWPQAETQPVVGRVPVAAPPQKNGSQAGGTAASYRGDSMALSKRQIATPGVKTRTGSAVAAEWSTTVKEDRDQGTSASEGGVETTMACKDAELSLRHELPAVNPVGGEDTVLPTHWSSSHTRISSSSSISMTEQRATQDATEELRPSSSASCGEIQGAPSMTEVVVYSQKVSTSVGISSESGASITTRLAASREELRAARAAWMALLTHCAAEGRGQEGVAAIADMMAEGLVPPPAAFNAAMRAVIGERMRGGAVKREARERRVNKGSNEEGAWRSESGQASAMPDRNTLQEDAVQDHEQSAMNRVRESDDDEENQGEAAEPAGAGDGVQSLLLLMQQLGVRPNKQSQVLLAEAHLRDGRTADGLAVCEGLREEELTVPHYLQRLLLLRCARAGMVAEAEQAVKDLLSDGGELRVGCVNALLEMYLGAEAQGKAEDVYVGLAELGVTPDARTHGLAIKM